MITHAPEGYVCPFCLLIAGVRSEHVWSVPEDIVYRDATVTAFIGARQWPNNRGHVIVIPNEHYENLYDLPDTVGAAIHATTKRIALAMKAVYGCAGISTRQHNEPAGNQDVWHYHLHVFPRYPGDELYHCKGIPMEVYERNEYARRLRLYLESME